MAGTYRINFNADGGSPTPSALTGVTQEHYEAGEATAYTATAKLPTSKPTKSGMSFASWSGYAAGANYQIYTTSNAFVTTLTARYTIQIGYDTNGGNESARYQTVSPNTQFTLLSFYPTRTGYTFKGWSTDSSATTATYQSGGKATRSANTRLYAVWEANTYTVSFNANGGTGAPSSQTKTYGQTLTLSSTVPTRTNYTFLGWSTSNSATTPTYAAGGSYTANASATLYAVWELAIRTLTLSFNANGGSNPPSSLSVETAESAYSFQVPQQVADTPYYAHHVFLGWSTEEDGAVEYAYPMSITIQDNTTLYAVWRLETFSVQFNANGGSNPPASMTKTYGQGISLPLIAPTKEGYSFLGWDTSSAGNVVVYEAGESYNEEASVVLYAVWQIETYNITYYANGGSDAPAQQTKTYNVAIMLSPNRPTRASYIFVGWGITNTDTTPSYQPNSPYTVNAHLHLHAIWKEATYDSADFFVDGEPCEVFIKGSSDAIYGADVIMI